MSDNQDKAGSDDVSGPEAATSAFGLLHSGIQRQLYQMGWNSLRLLQAQAIQAILKTDKDIILSAATASGKTEAAFLPILSRIADEPVGSVRAMYVGPLKALINDQFRRIQDLCEHLEVPVFHWHGDVSATEKARLIERPGGVLLITPESLESLFINRSQYLAKIFGGLRFVVIDELHSFLDKERGLHLRSLLSRLRQLMEANPDTPPYRVAALSATIGDFALGQQYVNPRDPAAVTVLTDKGSEKEIRYRIYGYCVPSIKEPQEDQDEDRGKDEQESKTDPLLPFLQKMASDIVGHCKGQSNLVFANSKADVEVFSDLAQQIGKDQGLIDPFLVHHGSLSAFIREDTEQIMKSGRPATTFCSSTLEMGIDIGSVKMVGQIGPSWSVSSQLQRMGRSGRHDNEPRVMRVYIECGEPGPRSDIFDRLHLPMIQAIAITELMLTHWLEPPRPPQCDLSTLTQQVMSVIAETGGLPAAEIYQRLCKRGPFGAIAPELFGKCLRVLGGKDVIEQMANGDLILGLLGERLRKDKGFYATFASEEEFSVMHDGHVLGTVQAAPRSRDHILFAGRRWQVMDVDVERREIHVQPAKGWKRPKFSGGPGEVHPIVRQKMRDVLSAESLYAYLDKQAAELLGYAKKSAKDTGICQEGFIATGPRNSALMTWTGSRIQDTLAAMFRSRGLPCEDEGIALTFRVPLDTLLAAVQEMAGRQWEPLQLAKQVMPRLRRKYDWLLNEELLDVCISRDALDCDGAAKLLRQLVARPAMASFPKAAGGDLLPSVSRKGEGCTRHSVAPAPDVQNAQYAKPATPIQVVSDPTTFAEVCLRLAGERMVALDVETTIWDKPRLLCTIQIGTPQQTWIVDALAIKDLQPLVPILTSHEIVKIIHNASFEQSVFAERGVAVNCIYDTCKTSRSVRPDADSHALGSVVLRELGLKMDKSYQKADWKRRPLPTAMIEYAALDVELLLRLHEFFRGVV